MTDRTDTAPPLGHHLREVARSFDVPAGDVDAVVRRGGHRLRRRRRALAGLTAVALVTGMSGAVDLLAGRKAEVSVSTGSGLVRGDVGIVWRTVSPRSGLGNAAGAGTAAPLYALSTAPGQAAVDGGRQRVVWRSDDGVEWTAVSTLGQDLYLSDLATRDDRVYAVGTGPATAAVGGGAISPLLIGWSDDGARTWRREALPLDLSALAGRTTQLAVVDTAVASGPAGTVVLATLGGTLDVPVVLPAGVTAPNGWAFTASGVDLLGPERAVVCPEGTSTPVTALAVPQAELGRVVVPAEVAGLPATGGPAEVMPAMCMRDGATEVEVTPQEARGVVASYTWEQLRVGGDLLRAVRRQPVAFVAPPGSDRFERVDLPALDPVQGPVLLEANDDGFDLVTNTMGERARPAGVRMASTVALHSPDGRSWASSSVGPEAGIWAAAMGRVGGVATIVGQRGDEGTVLFRADGTGGWTATPLVGALAAGLPEGAGLHLMSAAVGAFGIVAVVAVAPDAKPTDAKPTDAKPTDAKPTDADPSMARPPVPERRVLVSRDGTTWEDHSVAELVGRPVAGAGVIRASVVGERAVVAVSVVARDGDRPEQVVLLGTPG